MSGASETARGVVRCGCLAGCFFAAVGTGVVALWLFVMLVNGKLK